ncbi:MAG: YaeQ family protein [Candidatus Anammoxibacter sp.]
MGSKVNILRVNLDVSDLDRNYYQEHKFTIAHQSHETGIYIIARILAFTLNAHERLVNTKGTDTKHEPAIWQKDLTDAIELWIEIGETDDKRTRKACSRSKHVIIYTYKEGSSAIWWKHKSHKFSIFKNLSVISLPAQALEDLASMIDRTMEWQCTIQDGHVWIGNNDRTVEFDPIILKEQEE